MEADLLALFGDLVRLETDLWNRLDARLREDHGCSLATLDAMRVIAQTEQCRVAELARDLSITVGGASKAVDRIQRAGWCTRDANPRDGRSQILDLTPDGRAVLASGTRTLAEALHVELTGIDPDELRQLAATLARLRRSVPPTQPSETIPPTKRTFGGARLQP